MEVSLYIVATPIGNLSDISYRAVEVLKSVDYIACEDTRVTKILLEKYNIKTKVMDYHKFNEKEKSDKIINLIKEGNKIALVSDAGTPCISDPGSELVAKLRENNIKFTSIPGACAVITFLTHLVRDNEEFAFIGFIPRVKKQQIDILEKYKHTNCIFYESPNRLIETLENLKNNFGDIKISVARELTKVYEEVKTDSISNIIDYYKNNTLKGEIVVMIYAQKALFLEDSELVKKINILKNEGFSPKDISKIIAKLYGENKNKIYKLAIN